MCVCEHPVKTILQRVSHSVGVAANSRFKGHFRNRQKWSPLSEGLRILELPADQGHPGLVASAPGVLGKLSCSHGSIFNCDS